MKLAIFGTGGMGRELADIVQRSKRLRARYQSVVFTVDHPSGPVQGLSVLHPGELAADDEICFAIGNSADRRALAERFAGRPFATIVSDHALVSSSARFGPGAMVCDFAVINNAAKVGCHFLANTYAQVSHDCIIGDYVTLSPKTSCNGWVQIDDDVFVGASAVIRNGVSNKRLHIGRGATIGMGSIVLKDVRSGSTAIGTGIRNT